MRENIEGTIIRGKGYTPHSCECCGTEFIGRLNAKFCSTRCKNNFNNARLREQNRTIKKYFKVLEKNYKILNDRFESGKLVISHTELMRLGYQTNFLTSILIYTHEGGKVNCKACCDLVLTPISEKSYKIQRNDKL